MARSSFPPKKRLNSQEDSLKVLGGITVPEDLKKELEKGTKFCFQPHTSRPQLVAMIRHMVSLVAEEDKVRAIGEGIDRLRRTVSERLPIRLAFKKIVLCLKTEGLTVIRSNKEGGFAVMSLGMYREEAAEVMSKNLKPIEFDASKRKKLAVRPLRNNNLVKLVNAVQKTD